MDKETCGRALETLVVACEWAHDEITAAPGFNPTVAKALLERIEYILDALA